MKGAFAIRRGSLRAVGRACVRFPIELENTSLRYDVRLQEPWSTRSGFFQLGITDDEQDNYAAVVGFGGLIVIDKPTGTLRQISSGMLTPFIGQTYHMKLKNDGATLTVLVDDREMAQVAVAPRTLGTLFISCASESPLEIDALVIEGKPTPAAFAALRERWIAGRMKAAGLEGD